MHDGPEARRAFRKQSNLSRTGDRYAGTTATRFIHSSERVHTQIAPTARMDLQ